MSEVNIIYPLCCFTGKYCSYNTGFIDGYTVGVITIFIVYMIIELMFCLKTVSKQINIDESDDESVDESDDESVDESEEKSEDQKKDD